jgi:hypothetical protein
MAYGTVNADVIGTSVAGSNLGAGDASLMKNRIINGAMVIDQRNAGASVTVNNGSSNFFIADRWFANGENSDGVYTGQQVTTAPTGFNNSLKFTVTTADSSIGATQAYVFRQRIEGYNFADLGWGTANAKTITLSFQVQSSVTGTFGGSLFNSNGDRCYPFSYTISSANTWTSISVTIAGDTTGTWLTTNGTGVNVVFSLGTGSTYKGTAGSWGSTLYLAPTGSVDLISTNGATFYITGVQLEVGSSATGFEYRMYSQEYDLCRRYYEQFNFSGSGSSTINQYLLIGMAWTATDCRGVLSYYPKRAQPSSAVNSGTLRFATSTNGVTTGSGWTFDQAGPNNVLIYNSSMSGFTTGQAVQLTGQTAGNISISAEL